MTEELYTTELKELFVPTGKRINWTRQRFEGTCQVLSTSPLRGLHQGAEVRVFNYTLQRDGTGTILGVMRRKVILEFTEEQYLHLSDNRPSATIRLDSTEDDQPVLEQNIDIYWRHRKREGRIRMNKYELGQPIKEGLVLTVTNQLTNREANGVVTETGLEYVDVMFDEAQFSTLQQQLQYDEISTYSVQFSVNSAVLDRTLKGLSRTSMPEHGPLMSILLGREVSPVHTYTGVIELPPSVASLNPSQEIAVKNAMGSNLTLIQGPPGTGKTATAFTIVYNLFRRFGKVLVAAPSNNAADELTARIRTTTLCVRRLYSFTREEQKLTPHQDISFTEILNRMQSSEGMNEHAALKRLIQRTDVLVTTCIGCFSPKALKFRPKSVVIDEVAQATEPESLLAILRASKKVVLLGDHKQLSPTVLSRAATRAGLHHPLFERLVHLGNQPHVLEIQYRMHPDISAFSNQLFYGGQIRDGTNPDAMPLYEPWQTAGNRALFCHIEGREEISMNGLSRLNRAEGHFVLRFVTWLIEQGVHASRIEIISFYDGQREFLEKCMESKMLAVKVNNVDAFQGRENDFIILSCTRQDEETGIGFLANAGRLNVAITRAKYGMVVIGNVRVLGERNPWHNYLKKFEDNGLIFTWDHNGFRRANIPVPRAVSARRNNQAFNYG